MHYKIINTYKRNLEEFKNNSDYRVDQFKKELLELVNQFKQINLDELFCTKPLQTSNTTSSSSSSSSSSLDSCDFKLLNHSNNEEFNISKSNSNYSNNNTISSTIDLHFLFNENDLERSNLYGDDFSILSSSSRKRFCFSSGSSFGELHNSNSINDN